MQLNENIKILPESSITVKKRISDFLQQDPSVTLIHLDQTLMNMPLPSQIVKGMKNAVEQISIPYGERLSSPWSGYRSLKRAISNKYTELNVTIDEQEIFITSGLESANSCFAALFGSNNTVLLTDPCEPSLPQLHWASGRNVSFLRAIPENNFTPLPDAQAADLIYLSSPNSVTGLPVDRESLQKWVDYANEIGAVIVFDASLAEYLEEDSPYPRSIYEIEGAKQCAVEVFSFEKGFGVRELKIAFLTIPYALKRHETSIRQLFAARQPATATPPSFIMQNAAEMLLSKESQEETDKMLYRIKKVSRLLSDGLTKAGIPHTGGGICPFLWAQCPEGMSAWQCFDLLLEKAHLVVTPGNLFGYSGEHFIRLTSFGLPEEAEEASHRLVSLFTGKNPKKEAEEDIARRLFEDMLE